MHAMNTKGCIATEMIMKALNSIYVPSPNYLMDTRIYASVVHNVHVSVCSSVSPSACHSFVSATYLPNVWVDDKSKSHACASL